MEISRLLCKKKDDKFNFLVLKNHKEKFSFAERLSKGDYVSVSGIPKFRYILCTQLKQIKRIDESKQRKLDGSYTFSIRTNENK